MTTLFLVGTPIGNLADITYRAIDTLQQVDLIACEDTRVTRKLCNHYEIKTPLKSYHEHNKDQQTDYMIEQLLSGLDIALVSDAGLPLISDPGYELVVEARQHDIKVETIPGPNAGLTALMASGLPSYTYTFLGFLPRKDKEKFNVLSERMYQSSTLIIYESPHRVTDTLKVIGKVDPQRQVSLGRELTKKFEQIVTADVNTLLTMLQNNEIPLKGEFVILIEGAEAEISTIWFDDMSIEEHVDYYIKEKNIKPKAAIKMVAEDRQSRTSEIYNIYHQVD
ncbi:MULTISPECIES: 16S rRNA (cytidine(1402)-2'-O)-methyltransferase [Staphylococcus]|uniref:16S rRNA (cytidine(1402)-2'-O)-methyltransferase n=1 Tax=Staphylococcus TaxID=1279 RepID=UPI0002464356|nr:MULTISPECIES: 16S rRNA (cytidine(1402)-2'-O)-methyltransferase [Staphylococcus]QAV30993.1 16S rRNA (cytidine(1402)-2'-O)-methyltransferase [Sulfitobacter donghicola]AGZ25868.1 putative S-adenosylmethionine-dependent methyltransferase, YraL family [Staphylococcus pasteuri SP1]KAB7643606.1 16S rRNA (cytidine(1402)-2'-O)-methyltransferase [Staphylococcus sp. B2-b]MBN6854116.1 16S rRNA (cytidine(1402)-2'-O)-methyltransferase [Staphylococcus warneri]MBT2770516.1 16S rRNA (cytidine(1402)-2'-O)-me